ncbi:MAG: MCE family protein [Myxococcales bacterium]|nr:MCE family protein [Myxococcales bacterium]
MSGWRLWALVAVLAVGCKAEPFRVEVLFPETGGLKPGDNVTIRGLSVGQVSDVDLHPQGVVARLEIKPRYIKHLDDQAVFAIADEKLVTGKRMLTVTPGSGAPLAAGAVVQGQAVPPGPLDRATKALGDTVDQAEQAVNRAVDKVGGKAKTLGRDLLNPDRSPPRAVGGTIDLDRPGRFALQVQKVRVYATQADGDDWDELAGEPDLLVQVWVGERQVLLAGPVDGVLEANWENLRSEPFELSPDAPIRVKVLDSDTSYNDEIGVASLQPGPEDVGRRFRLAAGRIEELVVTLVKAEEGVP